MAAKKHKAEKRRRHQASATPAAAMLWPPGEDEWRELLQQLPPHADRGAVRQAIEVAVRKHIEDKKHHRRFHDLWQRIIEAGRSWQKVGEYFRLIQQLKDFPLDPHTEAVLGSAEALGQIRRPAKIRTADYAAAERLKSRLSRAWTDQGQAKMPISETGPFVDFFCAVTARVLPPGLGGGGVKSFVRREKRRRAMLTLLKAREGVVMRIDEDKVYLIDASGQRNPR